jgi:hypothetical protein
MPFAFNFWFGGEFMKAKSIYLCVSLFLSIGAGQALAESGIVPNAHEADAPLSCRVSDPAQVTKAKEYVLPRFSRAEKRGKPTTDIIREMPTGWMCVDGDHIVPVVLVPLSNPTRFALYPHLELVTNAFKFVDNTNRILALQKEADRLKYGDLGGGKLGEGFNRLERYYAARKGRIDARLAVYLYEHGKTGASSEAIFGLMKNLEPFDDLHPRDLQEAIIKVKKEISEGLTLEKAKAAFAESDAIVKKTHRENFENTSRQKERDTVARLTEIGKEIDRLMGMFQADVDKTYRERKGEDEMTERVPNNPSQLFTFVPLKVGASEEKERFAYFGKFGLELSTGQTSSVNHDTVGLSAVSETNEVSMAWTRRNLKGDVIQNLKCF